MKKIPLPAIEYLRERLSYEPPSGVLTWKPRPLESFATARGGKTWNTRYSGRAAGHVDADGYLRVKIDGRRFLAHRIVYAIATGTDPGDLQIDHFDGNQLNNRMGNLRLATNAENGQHRTGPRTGCASGLRNVSRNGRGWQARVFRNGKDLYLGTFDTPEQAGEAAKAARAKFFGEFAGVGEVA